MKREYGIDLLKMMAMTMVVAHHILNTGVEEAYMATLPPWGGGLLEAFHYFCYCAVDVFVMATGYIMCRYGFKYIRIFRLWRQVVGYSVALCLLAVALGVEVSGKDWLKAVAPVSMYSYWFFTQYAALFFAMPFLNKMIDALNEKETYALLATGMGLFSLVPLVAGRDLFVTKWGYCCLWFLFLYCFGASIHKLSLVAKTKVWQGVSVLVAGVAVSTLGVYASVLLPKLLGGGARFGELAYSYTSPSIVLEAAALVVLFGKIKMKSPMKQKVITFLAPGTFIVYVVHSNDVFRRIVGWHGLFAPLAEHGTLVAVFGTAAAAAMIFAAIVAVDAARRGLLAWAMRMFIGSARQVHENHGFD